MPTYNKLTPAILDELRTILGEKNVITDADRMQPYSHDEVTETRYHHMPEVVVFPESTEQTAAVVKLANRELIPVVPARRRYRTRLRRGADLRWHHSITGKNE